MAKSTKRTSNKSSKKVIDYEEFGTAGSAHSLDGYIQSEYQQNLKGNKKFEVY